MREIIQVKGLTKSYGSFVAIDDIHLSVEQGTAFGLLGPNGAGKSTTLECILGTKTPDRGEISLLGMNPRHCRRALFERVGVQFQEANYQEKITVAELCLVTASLYKRAADYRALLAQFGIAQKTRSQVSALSGGERQRLFIALTLIPDPQVVFLDELTTGLDAQARRAVWAVLAQRKAQGLTILMTSHLMDEVEALCDQICILRHGRTAFYGTVAQAIGASPHDHFEDAYLWHTKEDQ